MGRRDWQREVEQEDLSVAIGTSRHRGRGWKVFSILLVMGIGAFIFAYYVPLYRAHALLTEQYRKQMDEARRQRQQLTDNIETLKQVSSERDKLAEVSRHEQKDADASNQRLVKLEENLRVTAKKFLGKGRVGLIRDPSTVTLTLATPALLGLGTVDVSVFGKQALCAIAAPIKTSGVRVIVTGGGINSPPKSDYSFPLASGRAANVAKHLVDACGLDAGKIELRAKLSEKDPAIGAMIQLNLEN
jgi:chemotaxis protein MotB